MPFPEFKVNGSKIVLWEGETILLSLRDQANPDQRIEIKGLNTEMHNRPHACSGCSYKANTSQEWEFWLDRIPVENIPCWRGKPALAALAAAVQEGINLTWSQCSICWEKVLGHSPPRKWNNMSIVSHFLSFWSKTCQSLSSKALLSAIIFPLNHSNKHNPNCCVSLICYEMHKLCFSLEIFKNFKNSTAFGNATKK